MIDVIDALRDALEPSVPGRTVDVDDSCARPNEWAQNTLYVFPEQEQWVRVGTTGEDHIGEIEQRFVIRIVYAVGNAAEEPSGKRLRDVTIALNTKVEKYLAELLTRESGQVWDNLTAVVDHDYLRQFEVRGISIVATGYRLRSS